MTKENYNERTNIKISKEKKDLVKNKGYKLQEILNDAFDIILDITGQEDIYLLYRLDEINQEIKKLEHQKYIITKTLYEKRAEPGNKNKLEILKNKIYRELFNYYNENLEFPDDETMNKYSHILDLDIGSLKEKIINDYNKP